MPAETDELPQQLILDRYRPLEELGEGGYGSVVLAWDTKIQRRVAIKRLPLPTHAKRSRARRDAGLAEARTAALLNHPAIVTVHEWDTDWDEAFLIMECVDGASLADVLDDGGPLDADAAAAVLDAVFSAVEFAHENGVLHLDLKPQNVLVFRDGRVKVADFGISTLSTATGHGAAWGGTIGYMPPEQLRGQPVDNRTDVWSLGALAFEVLANANPFVSDSVEGSLFKIEVAEPSAPSDFERSLAPEVDEAILTALAADPAERYPSVNALATSLLPLLGDERLGRSSLAERVEALARDDAEETGPSWDRVGLWDRTRPYSAIVSRIVAALATAWLAWFGLSGTGLSRTPALVGTALAVVAAAIVPSLGIVLGLLVFAAGLFAQHAYVLGALFVPIALAYWWFVGREHQAAPLVSLGAPVLGAAHVALATPFFAGFTLPPLPAALASLSGGVLAILAWCLSAGGLSFLSVDWHLLSSPWSAPAALEAGSRLSGAWSSPFTYVALAAWALAAAVMSLACRRASRPAAFAGTALAAAVLWGGWVLAGMATQALGGAQSLGLSWETLRDPFARQITASLILVVLVIGAGPPVRPEEE